ncbi:MAG: fructokinase [Myxococcales bacterium]|nr:fructokinase [Myxococcales bacterium]|tara:strand:- start:5377 stop:6270 length:894 start_codon:yes stop_codon:yes gene_type:complete
MSHYLGIDIGGTKIAGVVLNAEQQVVSQNQIETPREDYTEFLKNLVQFIQELDGGLGLPVGIGMPGALSLEDERVKNSNIPCVRGRFLSHDLSREIARPIRIENDANCFALSEAIDGAGANAPVVFGVILGTGTGGGVVFNQHLWVGPNRIAGEWGHNSLPFATDKEQPGRQCYCGKTGCIETFISGPGMSADHLAVTGAQLKAWEIYELAQKGDAGANETLERHSERVAKSLASIINVLDPDVVVLGGGVSQMAHLYRDVPAKWGKYVYSDTVKTRLVENRHGPSSGVRGAAWLWK